jgi:hypothetical protein
MVQELHAGSPPRRVLRLNKTDVTRLLRCSLHCMTRAPSDLRLRIRAERRDLVLPELSLRRSRRRSPEFPDDDHRVADRAVVARREILALAAKISGADAAGAIARRAFMTLSSQDERGPRKTSRRLEHRRDLGIPGERCQLVITAVRQRGKRAWTAV